MTNEEAKKMLEAKLKCLIAETSGTNYDCNMQLCDGCALNYEQGNMGEQKEALDMAIKALEQQPSEDCISRAYIEPIVEELENICINRDEYVLSLLSNIKNAPSVTPQQTRWIPVSERLPEKYKEVIVTDIETIDTYQSYYIGDGYWECDNGAFKNRIIAWMPKPEPYKAESENKK